jgi:hypothetical protein
MRVKPLVLVADKLPVDPQPAVDVIVSWSTPIGHSKVWGLASVAILTKRRMTWHGCLGASYTHVRDLKGAILAIGCVGELLAAERSTHICSA